MMGRVPQCRGLSESCCPYPGNWWKETGPGGLKDEQIALNTMLVKLDFTEKGIQLLNTLDDPEVLLDAEQLPQLFFGLYGARQLNRLA